MMLEIRILAIVAVGIIANPGWADTRVRAGEHATFTRLVLYLPSQVDDWTVNHETGGYLLDISPMPRNIDTSDVFAFIPRTRVEDLSLRNGTVWIKSDCDCHISVFRARPDAIAVDIRDGPDPSKPAKAPGSTITEHLAISPFLLPLRARDIEEPWRTMQRIAFVPPRDPTPQVINSTELAQAVARAASGGVLRPTDADIGLGGPGIETRSALDSARLEHDARVQTELCSTLSLLDNIEAITSADAWQLVESSPSAEANVQRALAYLSLGFGAEAAVDFTDSQMSPDRTILLAQISRFIDAPDRPAPRSIRSAHSCGGVSALLAVMASPLSEDISEKHALEAVNVLSRLPFALRAHLAPHLERRLLVAGFVDLAQSAIFASRRATTGNGTGDRDAASSTQANAGFSDRQASLPQTAFFDARTSGPIYDTIAAGRFATEDRILIEAWIKESPSQDEADAASTFYVDALNQAGRPLDALAHLDMRFGRRGVVSPGLQDAIGDTLDAAARILGPGELLVLGARISERPWFDRLPTSMRLRFEASVDAVRFAITGANGMPAPEATSQNEGPVTGIDLDPPPEPTALTRVGDLATATPRRIAAEAAMLAASESLSRSARLRAEAAESTAEW